MLKSLPLLPEEDHPHVLSKRFLSDRKMALASQLLQRHYICVSTGRAWNTIRIDRSLRNKPVFGDSHYNISHEDGFVVLVGSLRPIGVDIVRCDITEILPLPSVELVFSSREMEALQRCPSNTTLKELTSVMWAFKEAYMKYVGTPDWDKITSFEFLDVNIPEEGTCVTNAVGRILIENIPQAAYTECHNLNGTHFIAIYTAAAQDTAIKFKDISLEDSIHWK